MFLRSVLPVLAVLRIAYASPSVLIEDDFGAGNDSLWHFQALAFNQGVLSPGLEADTRGRAFATGQLRVDPAASALRFVPRHGVKAHRSCFLGFRSDFRMEGVYASKVEVEIGGEVSNPAGEDSLGGLYILVRYENEVGNVGLARTRADIRYPGTIALDTAILMPVFRNDWISGTPLAGEQLARARSRVIGLGLIYISQHTSAFRSQSLLVGGFKAKGDLAWPRLSGFPEESEIMAGDTLELAWTFPRAVEAGFKWYRNENPVPAAKGRRFVFRPGPGDIRTHVFRAEVLLRNGDRIATEQLRVKVLRPEPPDIGRQSGDTSVPVGGDAIFRISATGLQPLSFQWYKDRKPVAGAIGPNYTFKPSAVSQGGLYQCKVTDKQGRTALSRSVTLVVKPELETDAVMPRSLSLAPRFGFNVSDFYRDRASTVDAGFKLNFLQAGLGSTWQLGPGWALQADLLFSRKGVEYAFPDYMSSYHLDYLEMPVLLRMRLGKRMPSLVPSLVAGGYGALLITATVDEDWGSWKGTESMNGFEAFDYGAVAGLSWQFGLLTMEWRYALGFAELEAAGEPRMNGAFSAMVGFTLFTTQEGPR